MLRIGIVTGEPSGDMLGAGLVQELSKKVKKSKESGKVNKSIPALRYGPLFSYFLL